MVKTRKDILRPITYMHTLLNVTNVAIMRLRMTKLTSFLDLHSIKKAFSAFLVTQWFTSLATMILNPKPLYFFQLDIHAVFVWCIIFVPQAIPFFPFCVKCVSWFWVGRIKKKATLLGSPVQQHNCRGAWKQQEVITNQHSGNYRNQPTWKKGRTVHKWLKCIKMCRQSAISKLITFLIRFSI